MDDAGAPPDTTAMDLGPVGDGPPEPVACDRQLTERVVLYRWGAHNTVEEGAVVMLEAGKRYAVRLDFYDNEGSALIELSWQTPCASKQVIPTAQLYPTQVPPRCPAPGASTGAGTGLSGTYFDDPELSGVNATRVDPVVDFT
jgi:hypothetical protein